MTAVQDNANHSKGTTHFVKIVILVLSLNSKKAMRNTKVSGNREVASFEEYIKHFAET